MPPEVTPQQVQRDLTPWLVNQAEDIEEYDKFPELYDERKYSQPYPCQTSSFLDLPPELRLVVYRHLLRSDEPFELWTGYHCECPPATWTHFVRYRRVLHLLRLCKQIRKEAAAVFYGENEFRISSIGSYIVCDTFFHTIGVYNVRLLRKLTLHVPDVSACYRQDKTIDLIARRGMASLYPVSNDYKVSFDALIGVLSTLHRLANHDGVNLKELLLIYPCGGHEFPMDDKSEDCFYYINRLKASIENLHISIVLYHGDSLGMHTQSYGHPDEQIVAWWCKRVRKRHSWLTETVLDMGWSLKEVHGLDDNQGRYKVLDAGTIVDDSITGWFVSNSGSDSD